jgi:hypothetical protein
MRTKFIKTVGFASTSIQSDSGILSLCFDSMFALFGLRKCTEGIYGEFVVIRLCLRFAMVNKGSAGTGRPNLGGTKKEPPNQTSTLADLGLDKKTSKLAQDIASLPDDELNKVKAGVHTLHEAGFPEIPFCGITSFRIVYKGKKMTGTP